MKMNDMQEALSGKDFKEGLFGQYLYKDGKKYLCQICKKKEYEYKNVPDFKRKTKEEYISSHNNKRKIKKIFC